MNGAQNAVSSEGSSTTVRPLPRQVMSIPVPMSAAPPVRVQPSYQTTIVRQAVGAAPGGADLYSH
ncbi:hypothetical protein CSUI_008261 [Cystoisospora suis]|uniref:Uncharacterized protein n=1 Tax=Cystoisospora suis TaxID=483139 RepID=A0A2C6KN64_9APIC|nr:hypothetical protein CSUI_008261 [Cystoisospora suis]